MPNNISSRKVPARKSNKSTAKAKRTAAPPVIELDSKQEIPTESARVDSAGRIVLPAKFRYQLGIESGDTVTITLDAAGVRIQTRKNALAKARTLMRAKNPNRKSLVDELIAERRAEAEHE